MQAPARPDAELTLDGLPALRSCQITFRHAQNGRHAALLLSQDSFRAQRDSLQKLTLSGVGLHVQLANFSWYSSGLPALASLAVRNVGLTDLDWLSSETTPSALAALSSLDLDDNDALQLGVTAKAALLCMTALKTLSLQETGTSGGDANEPAQPRAVRTAESVRHIAQLAAARPELQLTFWAQCWGLLEVQSSQATLWRDVIAPLSLILNVHQATGLVYI